MRYQEARGQLPIARANSPVLAKYDAAPLEHAIRGFRAAVLRSDPTTLLDFWLRLIHGYVQMFAQPAGSINGFGRHGNELMRIQLIPGRSPSWLNSWLSEKQFQRLCRRELGRSPQQQLMWLRMRRATEMLLAGDRRIQDIAAAVGYQNPFVFSTTFKRMMGWSPSDYPSSVSGASESIG